MSKSKNSIIAILTVCVVSLLIAVAFLLGRGFSSNAVSEVAKEYVICPSCLTINEVITKKGVKSIVKSYEEKCRSLPALSDLRIFSKSEAMAMQANLKGVGEQQQKEQEKQARDEQARSVQQQAESALQQQREIAAMQMDQQRRAMAANGILGIMSNMQQQQNTQQLIYEQRRPKRTTGTVTPNYMGGYDYDGTTR